MYSFRSRVRYSEVDTGQSLSLTAMMNYLQDCSTFQSEDLHLGIDFLREHHRAWWLSSWQIVIERMPRLGEEIVISTWPYDFKGIYGYRNFTIQDGQGDYLVKANSVWFFYDTEAGRPVRPCEADIRGYGNEPRLEMDYASRKIPAPDRYEEQAAIPVVSHHIDTNRHVNNAQYVAIAREALPGEILVRELRVEYKTAAVLGDVMIPRVSQEGTDYTVALCSQAGAPYAVVWFRAGDSERPRS
ncbi:MAG TPA: acyl-[acyl-carrier-protein] thioesterase [Candidatus Ventrimonas merdavium]|nr:acyl-[acyl-carrier-protein] thioesterase [Candidatus Ventrimonas merdavium]